MHPHRGWQAVGVHLYQPMENGSLVVEGPFEESGTGTFAITGGTGDYSGASGQMILTAAEDSTADSPKWKFAFEIN